MLQDHAACGGGGLAQAPCVRCLTFDRPVNPHEYEYYGTWLMAAEVAKDWGIGSEEFNDQRRH